MVDTGLCKKPRIRFNNAMPMLKPQEVAAAIMNAQRKDVAETCIPGFLLPFLRITR
jgi:all-trans-retinol dehydrogenase (NAD+)